MNNQTDNNNSTGFGKPLYDFSQSINHAQMPPMSTTDSSDDSTGVENVSYYNVTNQGAPANAQNTTELVSQGIVSKSGQSPISNGKSHHPSYVEIFQALSPWRPPTKEDVQREKKRHSREAIFSAIGDGITALSDLWGAHNYAPHVNRESMSAKAKERWDKIKADREKHADAYLNGYLRAMAMDAQSESAERSWQHQLQREAMLDARYDDETKYKRGRDSEQFNYQKNRDNVRDNQWKQSFDEGKRHAKAQEGLEGGRLALERKRMDTQQDNNNTIFTFGDGRTLKLPNANANAQTISWVFGQLPENVRDYYRKPKYGKDVAGKTITVGYEPPELNDMLIAIGRNASDSKVQRALQQIGGTVQGSKQQKTKIDY